MSRCATAFFAGVASFAPAGMPYAYKYDNEVKNSGLLIASCLKAVADAKMPDPNKTESCQYLAIGIQSSWPTLEEINALVEGDFMSELMQRNNSRPGGWSPAISACFS